MELHRSSDSGTAGRKNLAGRVDRGGDRPYHSRCHGRNSKATKDLRCDPGWEPDRTQLVRFGGSMSGESREWSLKQIFDNLVCAKLHQKSDAGFLFSIPFVRREAIAWVRGKRLVLDQRQDTSLRRRKATSSIRSASQQIGNRC
jgi:hypothetical protein